MTGSSRYAAAASPVRVAAWRAGAACLATLALALMAGCAGQRGFAPRTELVPFTPEQRTQLEGHLGRAYRIQEGDVLKVYFAYERELNQDGVVVLSDGAVSLVGVDRVPVAGLTLAEADSALTLAYSREYREPALSIMIQETQGRRVYVLGEVRNPGYYQVPVGGMEIMSAITLANGFTEDASREGTLIVRVTDQGYQFQEVNLSKFGMSEFAALATLPLRPYDIVYVPRSRSGDFSHLTKSVLTGLSYITRMAYDLYNVTRSLPGRY